MARLLPHREHDIRLSVTGVPVAPRVLALLGLALTGTGTLLAGHLHQLSTGLALNAGGVLSLLIGYGLAERATFLRIQAALARAAQTAGLEGSPGLDPWWVAIAR